MYPRTQEVEIIRWERARDILPRLRYEGPFRKLVDIACYYGFELIETPRTRRAERANPLALPSDRIALLRTYLEDGLDTCTQPVQLCYLYRFPHRRETHFKLDIIGTDKAIAEALIIHSTITMLRELGEENLFVAINSTGEQSSREQFIREATSFFRKHLDSLDARCVEGFKEDCLEPFRCTNKTCVEIREHAPQPITYLTDESRAHFSSVLEYLERLDIPFKIEHHLVGNRHSTTHTVFEIRKDADDAGESETEEVLARGERYDGLAKKAGLGRHIPSIGASIILHNMRGAERISRFKINRVKNPDIYLVHLGAEAKRGVLRIIEELRRAHVHIETAIAEESIARQLSYAATLDIPIVVIIGQKEILDGTAIVRNRFTHSQEIVEQKKLAQFLKHFPVA